MRRSEWVAPTVFAAYLLSCALMFGGLYNHWSANCPASKDAEACYSGTLMVALISSPVGPIYWAARGAIWVTK